MSMYVTRHLKEAFYFEYYKNIPAFKIRPCNLLLKNNTKPFNDKNLREQLIAHSSQLTGKKGFFIF